MNAGYTETSAAGAGGEATPAAEHPAQANMLGDRARVEIRDVRRLVAALDTSLLDLAVESSDSASAAFAAAQESFDRVGDRLLVSDDRGLVADDEVPGVVDLALQVDDPLLDDSKIVLQLGVHGGPSNSSVGGTPEGTDAAGSPGPAAPFGTTAAATPAPRPSQYDIDQLRDLLDLLANFSSNDQRARYLLNSNWMRDRDAARLEGGGQS